MERKLESFHCGCLRRILRVSYLEKATNDEIMSRSRMPQLSTMIMLKRIKWYGHIQRMEPGRLARSAFDWDPPDQYAHARRAPGGQRKNVDESNRRRLCTKQSIVHQIAGRKQQPGQRMPSTISLYSTSQNNQTNNSSCFVCICICICCQPCLYFIFGIKVLKQ